MTNLTGDTNVFSSAKHSSTRACVVFTGTRQDYIPGGYSHTEQAKILRVLEELSSEGWILSQRRVFDPSHPNEPMAIQTGFAHVHDIAGVFEAPGIDEALRGTIRLEQAGWNRVFRTEWMIGLREFAPVSGTGQSNTRDWAFLALWEWNDQWCAASPDDRRTYDLECDIAFKGDLNLGANISGRLRLDFAHHWHHVGYWEIESPDVVDRAIRGHEDVADFKYTTSRHIIGRIQPVEDMIVLTLLK